MSKKPNDAGDDLAEFKELIGDDFQDDGEISLDSIMAEYKYESATRRRKAPGSVDDDTARLMKVAEEMKKLAEDAQSLRKAPPPDEPPPFAPESRPRPEPKPAPDEAGGFEEPFVPQIDEAFFGLPEDFEKAFAPSEEFIRQETGDDEDDGYQPPVKKKEPFLRRLRRFLRRRHETPEISPEQACARLSPYVISLRLRCMAAFALLIPLAYIAFAHGYGWALPGFLKYSYSSYNIHLFVTTAIFVLIMLCGTDVIARGFSDILHLRPGMESLVSVSCAACVAHIISIVAIGGRVEYLEDGSSMIKGFVGFMPFTAVSAASVVFALWGHYSTLSARRRTYKIASLSREADSVVLEDRLWDGYSAYIRHRGYPAGFVARTEAPDAAGRAMSFIAPIFMLASFLLALTATVGQGRAHFFFWAWAAISASAAPFGMALAVALPYSGVSKRLAKTGAAIAGWSAAKSLSEGSHAVIGDTDLFPGNMVTLNGLKVFGRFSYDRIISIAASLLAASGSGLYRAVNALSSTPGDVLRRVTSFEHHEGGGVGGEIEGDRVLLGSSDFLLRMGIRLPKELKIKNAVFVTVNMDIAGIFAINYIPCEETESALNLLERQKITPLLAARDFNITPVLIKRLFGVNTDAFEYPTVEDRLALSDPGRESSAKPSAVLAREGLLPYAESIAGGTKMFRVARINVVISILGALGGLFLSFFLAYSGAVYAPVTLTAANMLLYMLIWCLPVLALSMTANKY